MMPGSRTSGTKWPYLRVKFLFSSCFLALIFFEDELNSYMLSQCKCGVSQRNVTFYTTGDNCLHGEGKARQSAAALFETGGPRPHDSGWQHSCTRNKAPLLSHL